MNHPQASHPTILSVGKALITSTLNLTLAFHPEGDRAYLPGTIRGGTSPGAVFVMDTSDPSTPTLETIVELDFIPRQIELSTNASSAYLIAENGIAVFDLSELNVTSRIILPFTPSHMLVRDVAKTSSNDSK